MKILSASLAIFLSSTTFGLSAGFEILKPHRAVYEVKLKQAEDRSGIKSIKGRIVYEVNGNECDGVSIRYRFVTTISTSRAAFTTDQQTATYESPDGKEFSFETKSFVNEQPDQKISGNAVLQEDGIAIKLNGKEPREFNIGKGVFTTSHLVDILDKAKNGERFFVHDVFDGSGDADKLLNSASVVGTAKQVPEVLKGESKEIASVFEGKEAWPITMSYFEKNLDNTGEALPIYETSFLLYESGVTRQLMMKYPDYELRASLTEIEFLKSKTCQINN